MEGKIKSGVKVNAAGDRKPLHFPSNPRTLSPARLSGRGGVILRYGVFEVEVRRVSGSTTPCFDKAGGLCVVGGSRKDVRQVHTLSRILSGISMLTVQRMTAFARFMCVGSSFRFVFNHCCSGN